MPFPLDELVICKMTKNQTIEFDCNDEDLNDFFINDANEYQELLLAKTYCFMIGSEIVALVSVCNDNIRISEKEKLKQYPEHKKMKNFPSVLVARIGVNKDFQSQGIGSAILKIIKIFFLVKNKTGCRYLTVDAYNNDRVLNFYHKNSFIFFRDKDTHKKTRHMYYDLIQYHNMLIENPETKNQCEEIFNRIQY